MSPSGHDHLHLLSHKFDLRSGCSIGHDSTTRGGISQERCVATRQTRERPREYTTTAIRVVNLTPHLNPETLMVHLVRLMDPPLASQEPEFAERVPILFNWSVIPNPT